MLFGFGMPGTTELVIILVIIVIFFGVGKLPAVLGQMGKGVKAFKDGMNDDDEKDDEIRELSTSAETVTEAEEIRQKTHNG